MKIMKKLLIILAIAIYSTVAIGQEKETHSYPRTGYPCPDFTLRNIEYFSKKQAVLADFKGRWLVLDFWNKYCTSCIGAFPKVNELHKEFKGSVQFMMVGREDKENQIRSMYAKFRKNMNLEMPCAFDSTLVKKWNYFSNPTIVVIDPKGIVRGITYNLKRENLRDFLDGKTPVLPNSSSDRDVVTFKFDKSKPMLINGNGGDESSTLYRSILSKFTPQSPFVLDDMDSFLRGSKNKGLYSQLGQSLYGLYKLAYFGVRGYAFLPGDIPYYGNYVSEVDLELKDTSLFLTDQATKRGYYCYHLTFPPEKASKSYIMSSLRQDLDRWFGYDVQVETRKMPYWRLVASEKAKRNLPTKGVKATDLSISSKFVTPHNRFKVENLPLFNLIFRIANHNLKEPPIIDETGIKGNIDIDMNCIFSDINEVKRELRKNGLDLVKGEKYMKVLVISDPKPSSEASK